MAQSNNIIALRDKLNSEAIQKRIVPPNIWISTRAIEVTIPPASKLVVTQNGVTRCYRQSGVPAVYQSHQEILVELSERWS